MNSLYCWIATVICLSGTVINVWRWNACFLFWIAGEIMWVAYDCGQNLVSRTILDLVGLALAVLGAWRNIIKPRLRARKGKQAK